jgi:predicted dehydrogenase
MPIGFGIAGCGTIADVHAQALHQIPGARLIACYSRRASLARQFAQRHECRAATSLAELLADSKIQAVVVATPSGTHAETAVPAARAGRHVIVEKPLEITLPRCDAIINACEQAGVVLSTIYQSRFTDGAKALKRAVDRGRFGRITLADAHVNWHRTQQYYDSGQWRGTWSIDGGGALMNQAIHSVDLLLWLVGDIASVTAASATLGHQRIEVEDTLVASLRYANGALGAITASTAAYPGEPRRIEIYGTRGSAALAGRDIANWQFAGRASDPPVAARDRSPALTGASNPASIPVDDHAGQLRDVVRAIRTGRQPAVDGREGRRSVEVVLAIYEAARSGRAVQLPLRSRRPRRG